ncbi:EamA family transporter [Bibersteinia trehalosi]|uniref:EamA family transporter n=1 Tax=Bibersteinia trehalosi TaxID=47735 RepID=A0A3R8LF96_BIBTR|nr:EamA family transporter [Bibersteinia trehalosi]RRN05860.1 EamA family transporter [Bibersteinia trehalosi]
MTQTDTSLYGSLAVLLAATLWGTTGTAAAFAPDVPAMAIGAVAMGGGGFLQALLAQKQIRQSTLQIKSHWLLWVVGAVAVAVYQLAFYGSMRLAGITIGTVVTIGSAPLLSALIEYVFDKQALNLRWAIGAVLGVVGMVLLSLAEHHSETGNQALVGIVLGLIAGLTYALYSWTARKMMLTDITPKAAMGATFGLGAVFLLPVLLATGSPLLASVNNFAVGLYMALVPMFIGYLAFGYGLARVKASTAITITLFEPVVAALLAVVIIGERLALQGWIGIVLILACLLCITLPMGNGAKSGR